VSDLSDKGMERVIAAAREYERLQGLTNEQLVVECLHTDATDYDVVWEMMSRLDQNWHELTPEEEAEEATRLAGLALRTPEAHTEDPAQESAQDES
jgi:hypothetical protein